MPEIRVLKYELQNPHVRDSMLQYDDEKHTYCVNGMKMNISVSSFTHIHFSPFIDSVAISNILSSEKMLCPTYEYYGMNAVDIKNEWKKRAELGTILHYDIESFYNGEFCENSSIEFQYFMNFVRDYSYLEVYRTEWRIFSEKVSIAGTIDMLFKDFNGNYVIFDWKRSKEISMQDPDSIYSEFSITPELSHLTKCKFNEYSIQLNTYKYILEEEYGIVVSDMYLCILHPINNNYKLYKALNLTLEIKSIMKKREEKFKKV
jgi:hypothetical protein